MRYNPILSIILGAVVIIVLSFIAAVGLVEPHGNNNIIMDIYVIIATLILILGGFIATYLARDMKVRYSIYLGLILATLVTIGEIGRNLAGYKGIGFVILIFVLFTLFTGIGGFIAKMIEKSNRQLFKEKHLNNGLSPVFSIVVGLVVAYIIAILLELITDTYQTHITSFGIVDFIIGVISIVIGAFVTTFLSKEKKILYGIYLGIIMINNQFIR